MGITLHNRESSQLHLTPSGTRPPVVKTSPQHPSWFPRSRKRPAPVLKPGMRSGIRSISSRSRWTSGSTKPPSLWARSTQTRSCCRLNTVSSTHCPNMSGLITSKSTSSPSAKRHIGWRPSLTPFSSRMENFPMGFLPSRSTFPSISFRCRPRRRRGNMPATNQPKRARSSPRMKPVIV
jgi:hypothetical protein